MKNNPINKKKSSAMLASFAAGLALLLVVSACAKDDEVAPSYEDGKSTVVYDLAGDTEASMGSGTVEGKEDRDFQTFLFRFRDQRQIWIRTQTDADQYLATNDWDIAFTGPYNAEIFLNNAHDATNPGFNGPAEQTAIVLIPTAYQDVTTAPSDETFDNSEVGKIGWASSSASSGWFQYSLDTHIMIALPNRTYALRLPDGKYAKLQIINAYQGNPATVTNMNWPAPYYTFRYFVQQDGSKNLNTK